MEINSKMYYIEPVLEVIVLAIDDVVTGSNDPIETEPDEF